MTHEFGIRDAINQTFPQALKPHVRHQRVYGMGTRGVMLIPVTSPIQCVAECANAGSAGKRTQPGVHRPNGPQFNMAVRVTSEHIYVPRN